MKRRALLVLGMHRSGTSAVTGVLVRLGIAGPRTLMPANDGNPAGYWESEAVVAFNERLLRAAGTSWDAWTPIDPGWWASASARDFGDELKVIVAREFGSSSSFAIKDPRLCRIAPFWLQHLSAADVECSAIVVFRDPTDVAASLAVRDRIPAELSVLMWLRHMLDAERSTRQIPRALVAYDDVLTGWRGVIDGVASDLAIEWPSAPEAGGRAVERFIRPDLCHHRSDGTDRPLGSPLGEWASRARHEFRELTARRGVTSDRACRELDAIRSELDDAAAVYGRGEENLRHVLRTRVEAGERVRDALHRRTAELGRERDALRGEVEAFEGEHAGLRDAHQQLERECAALREAHQQLDHECAALREAHQQLDRECAVLREAHQQLERECAVLRESNQQLERERDLLGRSLDAARFHVAALLSSVSWRVTAPGRQLVSLMRRVWRLGRTIVDP